MEHYYYYRRMNLNYYDQQIWRKKQESFGQNKAEADGRLPNMRKRPMCLRKVDSLILVFGTKENRVAPLARLCFVLRSDEEMGK